MRPVRRLALVLGAFSPIGAALLLEPRFKRYDHVVLAENRSRHYFIREMLAKLSNKPSNVTISPLDATKPFAGLEVLSKPLSKADSVDIFYLAHLRDRGLGATEVREHNRLMFDRVLSMAYKMPSVHAVLIVTDIGLTGDYPGRFSENWVDVGQTPFDEVDRSSLEVELSCLREDAFPIIRVRVGLVLNPKGVIAAPTEYWPNICETVVGIAPVLRKLPRFVKLPVAAAKGALAPITPSELAAMLLLSSCEEIASSGAFHAVIDPSPTIAQVLNVASRCVGGARLKPGLPVDKVAKLGKIPGLKELARRNADQIAAWWTPHRYCLSRNEVDTSKVRKLVPEFRKLYDWTTLETRFE